MTKFSRLLAAIIAASAVTFASGTGFAFPIAAPGTDGLKVIVSSTSDIIATYQGNSAAFSNDLLLDSPANGLGIIFNNHTSPVGSTKNLGSFTVGTELVFRLHVNDTGNDFFTGPAERNPDLHTHARVQEDWLPNESLVSFEDLLNGPFDFNDLSFSFTNVRTSAPSVPEPGSLALVAFGLIGLATFGALRQRRLS